MDTVSPTQILRILELTDAFNLHREAILIPLKTEANGNITVLPDGRLKIVCPKTTEFEMWLGELRAHLSKMDLSNVKK